MDGSAFISQRAARGGVDLIKLVVIALCDFDAVLATRIDCQPKFMIRFVVKTMPRRDAVRLAICGLK